MISRSKTFWGCNEIQATVTTTGQIHGDTGAGGRVEIDLEEVSLGDIEFQIRDGKLKITGCGGTEYQTLMEAFLWLGSQMVELADGHIISDARMEVEIGIDLQTDKAFTQAPPRHPTAIQPPSHPGHQRSP